MLDYEVQRKLIIVFILATILTIIGMIIALVYIWLPDNDIEQENQFVVGKIETPASNQEAVVQRYYNQLYIMFLNNDLDAIYNLVGKDYLEYFGYDKQAVIDFLRGKDILTRGLELVQYKAFTINGYSNVYELDLKVKDEAYAINVVIRETSPNIYTIAFDKFIDYRENTYTATKNSINLNIYKQIRYTTSIQYECKLTSGYNKNVKINTGGTADPVILVNTQQQTRRPIMTTLSAAEITLTPNEERVFTAVFDIEDTYDFYIYNSLVIKAVQYEGIQGTDNLEFTLN